jgi:hypothetical protein
MTASASDGEYIQTRNKEAHHDDLETDHQWLFDELCAGMIGIYVWDHV